MADKFVLIKDTAYRKEDICSFKTYDRRESESPYKIRIYFYDDIKRSTEQEYCADFSYYDEEERDKDFMYLFNEMNK